MSGRQANLSSKAQNDGQESSPTDVWIVVNPPSPADKQPLAVGADSSQISDTTDPAFPTSPKSPKDAGPTVTEEQLAQQQRPLEDASKNANSAVSEPPIQAAEAAFVRIEMGAVVPDSLPSPGFQTGLTQRSITMPPSTPQPQEDKDSKKRSTDDSCFKPLTLCWSACVSGIMSTFESLNKKNKQNSSQEASVPTKTIRV